MSRPRIGSLCSGYGGLELGLMQVVGGEVVWHAENDKHASKVLAARWPDVPNLGDFTVTRWGEVEDIDWLTAGYPCQPFSQAGKRKGATDERHIWPEVAGAIGDLRPRGVLLENVAGHLSLGLDDVLADLAFLGYDARWGVVRAAEAGAPHNRARVFIVAADASNRPGKPQRSRAEPVLRAAPDAGSPRFREHSGEPSPQEAGPHEGDEPASDGTRWSPANAPSDGWDEGRSEPARLVGGPDVAECGPAVRDTTGDKGRLSNGDSEVAWGAYRPAIQRWENAIGRRAPRPTEAGTRGGERLSPAFVEWMMGLLAGHVTDVDIPRNAQLKILGNGVVPQQCALAVRTLLALEARSVA